MSIQAAEISSILKEQIKNFGKETEVAEVGRVLSVGDGIARVYPMGTSDSSSLMTWFVETPLASATKLKINLCLKTSAAIAGI